MEGTKEIFVLLCNPYSDAIFFFILQLNFQLCKQYYKILKGYKTCKKNSVAVLHIKIGQ